MESNSKNFYDISYSIKIGPSIYYVLGQRMKNSKYSNRYFLTEDVTIRSKSATVPAKSSPHIQRSRSFKQSVSAERRPETYDNQRVTIDTNLITKEEQQKPNPIYYHRRYTKAKSKKIKPTNNQMIKNEREASIDLFGQETRREKGTSAKPFQNERKRCVKATTKNPNQGRIRLFHKQRRSRVHLLEHRARSITSLSTDLIKQIVIETLKSQQQILTKEFEQTLIQTIQQALQKSLSTTDGNKSQPNILDTTIINQIQDILIQTIEKYVTSTTNDTNITLTQLFAEQKQALVDILIQQQSVSPVDLIKQALTDALAEYNSTSITTNTATNITYSRQLNTEIQITADLKQTRIDAAFRQQRDTIVANRYLRDSVRQWSNVRSILSLIKKIQECSTNDLENAWLLFCWIGQNIHYDINCQDNSAECVFQNRTALSHGFVNLYHHCCSLLNIQCLQISGYIKDNEDWKPTSHVWNAIVFDQYIYLIDVAWGAGGRDNTNEFEDFYFLTSPEEFIYTHYSKDYQLLQPKITKQEFLSLPMMKSNYYRLNLNLLTPKQGFNQTNENLFQISLKTPAYVDLITSLQINNMEYPPHLHTLSQRDLHQTDVTNCFFAPPTNGLYDIIIYTKTNNEIKYQETIYMRLNVSNISSAITFPIRSQSFIQYKCILIEPFRRLVYENERIFIHMKIPDALIIKIKNGEEFILPNQEEYKHGVLKKEINVQGDIQISARWNDKTDKLSTICVFNMI